MSQPGNLVTGTAGSATTVSVCMPLYNEERHAGEALSAMLAQSYGDFELVISDNASTDRTGEICREFAARDSRVRYHHQATNIGAAANFDAVLHQARGRYLLWAGGHDLWDRELLEHSVTMLEARPQAVVAVAECVWIDEAGSPLAKRFGFTDTSGMSAVERFFTVLWGNMHPVLGLIRVEALRRTRGMRACMGADLLLLSELALKGDFVFVPGTRWYRREIRPQESYADMMQRYRSQQYRQSQGMAAGFPLLTLGAGLLGVAWKSDLPFATRLAMCAGLAGTMPARYVGARLRRR